MVLLFFACLLPIIASAFVPMKTYSSILKFAIREKIRRATGLDPGRVHPEYLLTSSRGGIHTSRLRYASRATCTLAVHFIARSGSSTRWISFDLN